MNINKPLTNEQIWGVPDEELPEPKQKDYFDLQEDEKQILDERENYGEPHFSTNVGGEHCPE